MEKEQSLFISGLCSHCQEDVKFEIKLTAFSEHILRKGGRTGRKMTEEKSEKLNELIRGGELSRIQIANELGLGYATVFKRAQTMGVKLPNSSSFRWMEVDPFLSNLSIDKLMAKFNWLSPATIYLRRRKLGIPQEIQRKKRTQAKILYGQGLTMEQIGTVLRVTRQRVEQYIKDI